MLSAAKTAPAKHNCDHTLNATYPRHSQSRNGEHWVCTCGKTYEHVCDEAEGCYWTEVK